MKITSTKDYKLRGVKVMSYGEAGVGKTFLCSTAPEPIILSAESGLLSLANMDLPVVEITALHELIEAYKWCKDSKEADQYQTICIDSISDIAEVVLAEHMRTTKDGRQAYGEMADDMAKVIRRFRDLVGRHVYFTAKIKRFEDSSGVANYMPYVPGQILFNALPFFFDEVFAFRFMQRGDKVKRWLQTMGDSKYVAKDRSGCLKPSEDPDLTAIFNKIMEGHNGATTTSG